MSSARVESPLLQGFRRRPSSQAALPGAPKMPKSRACRQLFPVDRKETDRYLDDQLARIAEKDRRTLGLDLDTLEQLPLSDEDDSPRYIDWEAVPAYKVPAVYHEVRVKHQPHQQKHKRPTPFSEATCLPSPPSIEGISNESDTLPTVSNDNPSTSRRTEQSQSAPSLGSIDSTSSPQDARSLSDLALLSRSWPEDAPSHASRRLTKPTSMRLRSDIRDSTEPSQRSNTNTRQSRSSSSVTRSSSTQSKMTDYMRQRKRNGSGSSASSETSSDAGGEKHQHVPHKRRHASRSAISSPAVEGNS